MLKRSILLPLTLGAVVLLGATMAPAGTINLTLVPITGSVSGPPGSTIGWGYTITNNSSDWIQTLSASAGVFLDGTPKVIFDFPAVAPGGSVTLDFSLIATGGCTSPPCGLYELTWNGTASLGFTDEGTFTVASDFYSAQPGTPGAVDLGPAPNTSAQYSAKVGSTVPEPTALSLLIAGLGVLVLSVRRRKESLNC